MIVACLLLIKESLLLYFQFGLLTASNVLLFPCFVMNRLQMLVGSALVSCSWNKWDWSEKEEWREGWWSLGYLLCCKAKKRKKNVGFRNLYKTWSCVGREMPTYAIKNHVQNVFPVQWYTDLMLISFMVKKWFTPLL